MFKFAEELPPFSETFACFHPKTAPKTHKSIFAEFPTRNRIPKVTNEKSLALRKFFALQKILFDVFRQHHETAIWNDDYGFSFCCQVLGNDMTMKKKLHRVCPIAITYCENDERYGIDPNT